MPEYQPTESEYVRQIVRDELQYSTPRLAVVTEPHAHSEPDDGSNYEVDVKLVGTGVGVSVGNQTAGSHTLDRVPVAVSMNGATRGLQPGDLVLIEFLGGDGSEPVVTHAVYGDEDDERAPLTEPGDFRRQIGQNAIIEIVTDEDDHRKLNIGRQPDDRDGIDMGLTFNLDQGGFCLMDGSQNGLFFNGEGDAILKWDSMAMPILADGDVNFESGGTAGSQSQTLASGSGMDEAEYLAAGLQTTTTAAAAVRESDAAGLGLNPRLPTTWTQAAHNAAYVPEPVTSETVDLASEGLRPGDVIDPYLQEFVRSETRVVIPAGEYQWRGDGLTGNYRNAAVVGRGGLVELRQPEGAAYQTTITVPGGGDGSLLLANLAIRGESATEGACLRIQVADGLSSALLDGIYLPDGGQAETVGIGVSPGHTGDLWLRNSVIADFPGGGLHASAPGMADGGNGPVFVEGGLYRDNGTANVRIGSGQSALRAVTVQGLHEQAATAAHGIWVTESGTDIDIEECDIVQTGSAPAIQMSSPAGTTAGTITDTRITNDGRAAPIAVAPGHDWSGSGIHLTGSGPQAIEGDAAAFETVTGEAAAPAARVPQRVD